MKYLVALFMGMTASVTAMVPTQPRIIALAPHVVENLYAIGAGDFIVATTEHADFPVQAKNIPRVGNYVRLQIEQILALNPTHVIVWRDGNPADDLARLEQLGLHLVESNPQQLLDVAKELRQFGLLFQQEEQAMALALSFEEKLQAIRSQHRDSRPLKVFYELWPQPLTTVAQNSWPQQILTLCGVENVFASLQGDYPMISIESVLAMQPQVIIQPNDSARRIAATDWQQWPSIPAVAHQAILHPDADQLHRMTARMLNEAEQLCAQLRQLQSAPF